LKNRASETNGGTTRRHLATNGVEVATWGGAEDEDEEEGEDEEEEEEEDVAEDIVAMTIRHVLITVVNSARTTATVGSLNRIHPL
jgi:CO dehydrogenase/acetyl-CoA synthase beta subunit